MTWLSNEKEIGYGRVLCQTGSTSFVIGLLVTVLDSSVINIGFESTAAICFKSRHFLSEEVPRLVVCLRRHDQDRHRRATPKSGGLEQLVTSHCVS